MNRYLESLLLCLGITFFAASVLAAESPYLLPTAPKKVQVSASVVDVLYQQAQRHAANRDRAYSNLNSSKTELARKFWITTMVKEEASRLLMFIRALKALRQVDTRQRERLRKVQTLAFDPQVQQELAGMEHMLSKIRELTDDELTDDNRNLAAMEQNLSLLFRLYNPEYTARALARKEIDPKNEFRLLAACYSQLQQQFDSLIKGARI